MNQVNFSLIPFDWATAPNIAISGSISRDLYKLKIEYLLTGEIDTIIIPPLKAEDDRLFDLWNHTCFEIFLGIKDTPEYWEFNLSPTSDWNVFHFLKYRHNIVEEVNFNFLPATIVREKGCLKLALEVELDKIISPNINLEIGITAVIEGQYQISYWTLKHAATKADFHDRDTFSVAL